MTSRAEIREWFQRGVAEGKSHMIVVCDTFDYEDYPVFANSEHDAKELVSQYDGRNMQRVMEVYNLSGNMDEQLNQRRAYNF